MKSVYVPLNVNSVYSLLYGTGKIEEIAAWAKENGFGRIALTDRNNLYAVHMFISACRNQGLIPVIGTTLVSGETEILLYAKNREGFSNICRILTERNLDENFDPEASLRKHMNGIVIVSDDIGILKSMSSSGADIYVLVRTCSQKGLYLSRQMRLKPAAAGENIFFSRSDYDIHRVLRSIDLVKTVSSVDDSEMASPNSFFLTEERARFLYSSSPESLKNSVEISEKCRFNEIFDGFIFPSYKGSEHPEVILRERVYIGAEKRYGKLSFQVRERIEKELSIIIQKGFSAYFLVVADIVSRASRICGRGSGAASIVSYSLGITNVDPVKYDLYFERFLNPERDDMPDIDVDFAWDERDEILENTIASYGHEYCAMVCTFIHFRGRSALRDAARAYGIPENEISSAEKRFLRKQTTEGDDVWDRILSAANKMQGFPKHLSVHVGGVVAAPEPLSEYVPLEKAPKGINIVTWDKDGVEDAGLVKIDLLGNRSLAVIRDSSENARENGTGLDMNFCRPADDPDTRKLIAEGNTIGVFYVESPAMRQLQKKTSAGDFEHLVIHSSIIRPAANRYINLYIDRLRGAAYPPITEQLDGILGETYGIMVYQEDVSKAAVAVAGFNNADADGLRKILSKRNKARKLEEYRVAFYEGAARNGLSSEKIDEIWKMIISFDGYSFCKPHSASYAMVSFQSAYIKCHFPAEFMAAVISNGGGYYTVSAYISEAKRIGLRILPPDVNESRYKYFGRGRDIRTGLMAVKNLSYSTCVEILRSREKGKFISLDDFISRVRVPVSDCEVLAGCGALDCLSNDGSRPGILWKIISSGLNHDPDDEEEKNMLLFDSPGEIRTPDIRDFTFHEKLRHEYELLGFLCSEHPLVLWKKSLQGRGEIRAVDLPGIAGSRIEIAGWMVTRKAVLTVKGNPMEFISFEDETGIFETVLFPDVFSRFSSMIEDDVPYIIKGLVENQKGAIVLTVENICRVK